MKQALLTVEGLGGAYGSGFALQEVSFTVEEGTLTALLGANGSGKTTLLKMICQQRKHQGACRLAREMSEGGGDVGSALEREAGSMLLEQLSLRQLSRQVSYIPQRSGITVGLTVLDVVLMGFNPVLGLLEGPSQSQRRQAAKALEMLGLAGYEERDYLSLSEGQKQLAMLARTLLEDSRLLILDEPDSALDIPNRCRLMERLRALVREGRRAGLLSLHDPQLALEFCDQLLLIRAGRCVGRLCPGHDPLPVMEEALAQIYGPITLAECVDRRGRKRLILLWEQEEVFPCAPDEPVLPVGCIIMASGVGRRFGGNKLLARLGEKTLLEYALEQTDGMFARRVVVTRHPQIAALCQEHKAEYILHDFTERNDTVRVGVEYLQEQTAGRLAGYLFCPADQPLMRRETLETLLLEFSRAGAKKSIFRLSCEGKAGAPVLFGSEYGEALKTLPRGKGGSWLVQKHPLCLRMVEAEARELWDVDTPGDLERCRRAQKRKKSVPV